MNTNVNGTLELALSRIKPSDEAGLDEYLTYLCLDKSIGEVVMLRETARNLRAYWGSQIIFNAVFEKDINAINEIAKRVDGTIPESGDRDRFANILGDAIEDVLNYEGVNEPDWEKYLVEVSPYDPTIIAIAKSLIMVSMISLPKMSTSQLKRDRQKALEIILSRTGGRKTEPTREALLIEYVDNDWEKGLPSGE